MGRSVICQSLTLVITGLPKGSRLLPSIMREDHPHTTSPGKDPNSKLEVQFLLNAYGFCTIMKSKNGKSNHHRSVEGNKFSFERISYIRNRCQQIQVDITVLLRRHSLLCPSFQSRDPFLWEAKMASEPVKSYYPK